MRVINDDLFVKCEECGFHAQKRGLDSKHSLLKNSKVLILVLSQLHRPQQHVGYQKAFVQVFEKVVPVHCIDIVILFLIFKSLLFLCK